MEELSLEQLRSSSLEELVALLITSLRDGINTYDKNEDMIEWRDNNDKMTYKLLSLLLERHKWSHDGRYIRIINQ